jgi:hypothetical protein
VEPAWPKGNVDFQISVPRLRSPMNPGALWRVIGVAWHFKLPCSRAGLTPSVTSSPDPLWPGLFSGERHAGDIPLQQATPLLGRRH